MKPAVRSVRLKKTMTRPWLRYALIPALAAAALAQEEPTFRSGVNLVKIDAAVIDGKKLVDDLKRDDFVVLDEGREQPLEYFAHDTEPLRIVLLLDVSGSMKRLLEEVSAAANKALAKLQPDDEMAVMLFARNTLLHQELTTDRTLITDAINDSRFEKRPGQSTDINPAIVEAARYLRSKNDGKQARRAIIVLTDNVSMSYRVPDEAVMESLYAADAVLMAMVTKNAKPRQPSRPGANPDFTEADVFAWAEESGGEVLRVEKGGGEAFERALERLRTRYSLHYRAAETPARQFRRIEVRLSDEARKRVGKAEVRARDGYFTEPAAQ